MMNTALASGTLPDDYEIAVADELEDLPAALRLRISEHVFCRR